MPVLSERALEGLKEYRYKAAGYTILDRLHQPALDYITDNILPRWLAPNLITLLGLAALLINYGITAYLNIDFTSQMPRWSYLMSAFAVFFYLHMDNLDGKQARKTKTSSPLGQLFDHGCDALAVHLILVNLATSLQMGHDWQTVTSLLYVYIPWNLAHWEEYHTGVMQYGGGLWGVTEANYVVVFVHLCTYLLGPESWTSKPLAHICSNENPHPAVQQVICGALGNFQINEFILGAFGLFGLSLFYQQVTRVFKCSEDERLLKITMPKNERGDKSLGWMSALSHLAQILWTNLGCGLILMIPLTSPTHSRVLFAIHGINFALQATRIMIAHMTKEPFAIAIWPNIAIIALLLNYYFPVFNSMRSAELVLIGILIGYLYYVIRVIRVICASLGISALTISPKKLHKSM